MAPGIRSSGRAALIALDVSRLLRRAGREAPTGIDRIELAYAEHFAARGASVCFAAANAAGGIGLLPQRRVALYLEALAAAWRDGGSRPRRRWGRIAARLAIAPLLCSPRLLHERLRRGTGPPVYLLVSHHHLERRRPIARLKRAADARFICLVHDLLPIQYPEYSKPGQAGRHRRRIGAAADLADAVIVSSTATRDALLPYLRRAAGEPPVLVAPFGSEPPTANGGDASPAGRPYFVLVGTIEVRKNHILMLNLWRRFAEELGPAAPELVLIGRRGWLAQPAFDMIDRCPGLRDLVVEHGRLDDAETARLVKGARALLLPSFAEGFGLPLLEALAQGVPVLCSDTSALRETGGAVPDYLDPLDGAAWHAAILDYARSDSPRRTAQLRRLADWRPPLWREHFAAVDRLIEQVVAS